MVSPMRTPSTAFLTFVALLALPSVGSASIVYSTAGVTINQNFDTLAQAGSPSWADNSTIPGWYTARANPAPPGQPFANYSAGTGSSATGGLYSFGVAGAGPITDRALGSISSDPPTGPGNIQYGIAFQNTTGLTLTSFNLSYVGEQWRDATGTQPQPHTLTVSYRTTPTLPTIAGELAVAGTPLGALTFNSLINNTIGAGSLDGNAPENRTLLSGIAIPVTWLPNQYLWVRWEDNANPGADHGLAIDDVSFTAFGPAAVPEPASVFGIAGVGIAAACVRRFRNRKTTTQLV